MNISDVLVHENAVVVAPIAMTDTLADVSLSVLLGHATRQPTDRETVNFEPLQERQDGDGEDNYI